VAEKNKTGGSNNMVVDNDDSSTITSDGSSWLLQQPPWGMMMYDVCVGWIASVKAEATLTDTCYLWNT
jgi:hypothetical protein